MRHMNDRHVPDSDKFDKDTSAERLLEPSGEFSAVCIVVLEELVCQWQLLRIVLGQ